MASAIVPRGKVLVLFVLRFDPESVQDLAPLLCFKA